MIRIFQLLLTVLILSVGSSPVLADESELNPVKVLGGEMCFGVITKPEQVDAFRISTDHATYVSKRSFKTISGPVQVDAKTKEDVIRILSSPQTYSKGVKRCAPTPGVKLSFFRGPLKAEVFLCFECNTFDVVWSDQKIGGQNFDNAKSELVRIVKKLFPNDEVIQKLTEDER